MIALDTETTGIDFRHGAMPYLVTVCDDEGNQSWWEWDVDPLTRMPVVPAADLDEIRELVVGNRLVLQNAKFDITALATLFKRYDSDPPEVPWERIYDTLLAGHLLASNEPHDLTSMAIKYLGVDIEHYEKALEDATKAARRWVAARLPDWRIAKGGEADMPSVKEKTWKVDCWLPRALVKHLWEASEAYQVWKKKPKRGVDFGWLNSMEKAEGWEYHPSEVSERDAHPWWTVCSEYANADTATTIALWWAQEKLLKIRNLEKIYNVRRRILPIVYEMEEQGVTVSEDRLEALRQEYLQESAHAESVCVGVAGSMGYNLDLPRGAVNKNLQWFCFGDTPDCLQLPPVVLTETGNPSLNARAIDTYLTTLEPGSKAYYFLKTLAAKRKRDTAVTYMDAYKRFWVRTEHLGYWVLHPSLNPTGTHTLRFSCQNPNEQNISKKEGFNLRAAFGPAPGREWWCADAENIELRLPAYESGETEMIQLFERPKDPPYYGSNHLLNFHTVYPDIWEAAVKKVGFEKVGPYVKEVYASTWYQFAKNGGFAVQYGAIDRPDGKGTADLAFHRPGCHALLKRRFLKIHGPGGLNERCIQHARRHGYVETLPDRTVDPDRGYPLLCTRTEGGDVLPTVPLNYRVQGSAMWWMIKAMIRVRDFFDRLNQGEEFLGKKWPGGYHIVMQVHDEMVFDMPAGTGPTPWEKNKPVVMEAKRLMEEGGRTDYGIPTPVSVKYHPRSWSEGQKV